MDKVDTFQNIVWVGSYPSKQAMIELSKAGYKPASAYVAQDNIIQGIRNNFANRITILSAFKFNGRLFHHIPKSVDSTDEQTEFINSSVLSIPYIQDIWNAIVLPANAKEWAVKHSDEKTLIFCYAASYPQMKAALAIKNIIKDSITCIIIPDLPQFMSANNSLLYRIAKWIDYKRITNRLFLFDKYICFTKGMISKLGLDSAKCSIMEGCININELNTDTTIQNKKDYNDNKFRILYSGVLGKDYGIELILEAFVSLKGDNYELIIAGAGELSKLVSEYSNIDNRIVYKGYMNREDLLKLQKEADVFYVGRLSSHPSSKYCFPSKIFEYITAKKLVMAFPIEGIAEEYFSYLIKIKEETANGIIEAIREIEKLSAREVSLISDAGFNFIKTKKNNIYQTKQILNFVAE